MAAPRANQGDAAVSRTSRQAGAYRGRFAPSPSGWLHLGNARTALLAWGRARSVGGAFVMRVEDLDAQRTRPEAVVGNLEELRWLGLDWDEGPDVGGPHAPYLQSQRSQLYEAALAKLVAADLTFPCYLSRKELAEVGSAPHGPSGSVYGEAERRASERLAPGKVAEGRAPSIRFAVPDREVRFVDALAGPQVVDVRREVGHFVVRRSDGLFAYQLAVVVDDAAMGITDVLRGADLLASTARQILLYRALHLPIPRWTHVPLLTDATGDRFSKRSGALSLRQLRERGVAPQRVVGWLASTCGLARDAAERAPADLLADFDLRRLPVEDTAIELPAWARE